MENFYNFAKNKFKLNKFVKMPNSLESTDINRAMQEDNNPEMLEGESGLEHSDVPTDIYPNAEVRISKVQYSLLHIKRLCEDRRQLVLAPDFQRDDVWSTRQKCELVESILMGIPIPVIYFFEAKDGTKQVVDGRQRISAILDFLNNKFKLSDLKILSNLNGLAFDDLEPKLQGMFEDYQLFAYVIQPPTPERVKYDIFDRVNRGGTRLNSQEMRNALYQGNSVRLINKICKSEIFCNVTDGGISDKRMRDQYVALRILAFSAAFTHRLSEADNGKLLEYRSDIDDFLAKYMIYLNKTLTDETIETEANRVLDALRSIYTVLGHDAFRFASRSGKRRPINMPLVEIIVYLFQLPVRNYFGTDFKDRFDAWKDYLDNSGMFRGNIDSSNNVLARCEAADRFYADLVQRSSETI